MFSWDKNKLLFIKILPDSRTTEEAESTSALSITIFYVGNNKNNLVFPH